MDTISIISNYSQLAQPILYGIGCVYLLIKVFKQYKKHKTNATTAKGLSTNVCEVTNPITPLLPYKNQVFFFGEFTVLDKKGDDISHLFGLKLRLLFVLIMSRTLSDAKGITSESVSLLIWPDKEPKESKNNKGVLLSRLRNLLQWIEGIKLTFCNGKYAFTLSEPFFCDYIELMKPQKCPEFNSIQLTRRGFFLPQLYAKWIDEIRNETENIALSLLEQEVETAFSAGDYSRAISGCISIFTFDAFHELALQYIVSSHQRQGNPKEAAKAYTGFCFLYTKTFGCEYPLRMDEVKIP